MAEEVVLPAAVAHALESAANRAMEFMWSGGTPKGNAEADRAKRRLNKAIATMRQEGQWRR